MEEDLKEILNVILKNIEDLDPEYSKVIDEYYWDLV